MRTNLNRRLFLGSGLAAGSAFALTDLGFFGSLPPVSAAELQQSDVVMLQPDIEPIVKLIESTPRNELLEVIGQLDAGNAVYTKQNENEATLAPKMKKNDGWLDFSKPAHQLQNTIRAFWSWPGAQADYYSKETGKCYRATIASAEVIESDDNPGTHGILDEDLNVICGKDRLRILKIKPAGSHIMDFQDFVNGRQSKPGDLFMQIENRTR